MSELSPPQQSTDPPLPSAPYMESDSFAQSRKHLDRTLFQGIAWTALGRWTTQGISWIATFYAARILTPSDYGLVAMASIPIGLARLIEDLGLDAVILQDRTLTKDQLQRLTGAAILLSIALAILFIALSIPISLYFKEPQVALIVSALSLTFLFDALQVFPRAMLQRDLQFRTLALINAIQVTIAAATMILAARAGWMYWTLVINTLVSYGLVTIILYFHRPFVPAWPREIWQLTNTLITGWRILVTRFAYYGYSSADSMIVGRYLGKEALGVFGFATNFSALPSREITSLVSGVVPGVFTAVQSNKPELRRYFFLLTEATSYLAFPAAIGLALTADDFVLLTLGDTWAGVIVPLQILCLYAVMFSSQTLVAHVLLWTGHFSIIMWLSLLPLAILPICFYIGAAYGLIGVAIGWLIGFPLSNLPGFVYINRILACSWSDYKQTFRPALTGCAAMLGVVILIRLVLPDEWHHGLRLAVQSSAGALVYAGTILWLFGNRVQEIYHIVLGRHTPTEAQPAVPALRS